MERVGLYNEGSRNTMFPPRK